MLFEAAELNLKKNTNTMKRRCHLFIPAHKGKYFQTFYTPTSFNVRFKLNENAFQFQYSREFQF